MDRAIKSIDTMEDKESLIRKYEESQTLLCLLGAATEAMARALMGIVKGNKDMREALLVAQQAQIIVERINTTIH